MSNLSVTNTNTGGGGSVGSTGDNEQKCYINGSGERITVDAWVSFDGTTETFLYGTIIDSEDVAYSIGDTITAVPTGFDQIACETASGSNPTITQTCYLESIPAQVDAFQTTAASDLGANSLNGRGYVTQRLHTVVQIPNGGDGGGGIEGYPAGIQLDADGVPHILGEYTETNVTTMTRNEGSAYGEYISWEGFFFFPSLWNGTEVGSVRIQDSYTSTTQSDRDELWVSIKSGTTAPSLDRSELTNLSQAQVGNSFTTPSTWKNQWFRIFGLHTDQGGASQVNYTVDILAPDGSVIAANQAISRFLWNLQTSSALPLFGNTQRIVTRTYDSSSGTNTWTDAGSNVLDPNDFNQPIIEVDCDFLPINYDVVSLAGSTSIQNVALGNGAPYTYSFDGGVTFGASNTYVPGDTSDSTEQDAHIIIPMVMDSAGAVSSIKNPSVLITDPVDQSGGINIVGASVNDTEYDDGTGSDGGWKIEYSTVLGENMEQSNFLSPSSGNTLPWIDDGPIVRNTSYTYMGWSTGGDSSNMSTMTDLDEVLPVAESGVKYTLSAGQIRQYYTGLEVETVDFTLQVVDQVTSTVLGTVTFSNQGNTAVNDLDTTISFIGAGNPVRLEMILDTNPTAPVNGWIAGTNVAYGYATLNASDITKSIGAGWNAGYASDTSKLGSTGPSFSFDVTNPNLNAGMHGINASGHTNSYASGDYVIYVFNDTTNVRVYENGTYRGNFTPGGGNNSTATFTVEIVGGNVEYKKNGTTFYTSTVAPDLTANYWTVSYPYNNTTGINNISWNGDVATKLNSDSTGHYHYIDQLGLFEGAKSDTTHYFEKIGSNYLLARNMDTSQTLTGYASLTTDIMDVSSSDVVSLVGDIRRYGTLLNGDLMELYYRLDGGSWVKEFEHDGQFDAANETYFSPFTTKGIDVSGADDLEIELRLTQVTGVNRGWYVYGLGFQEIEA